MHRFTLAVCIALVTSSWGLAAHAQWKWRDSAGQIHLSDLPPPRGTPAKDVLQRPEVQRRAAAAADAEAASASAPAASAAEDATAKPQVDPALEARRKQAEQEELALRRKAEHKQAAVRVENCQRAKVQLRTLDSGVRLARVNEKGEREIIDDALRAQEMQRARDVIASECR
jgi:hypothetical protein